MAGDVVGYSRLMGIDEEGTLGALKAIRRELGDPKIGHLRLSRPFNWRERNEPEDSGSQ
jgi:hypothetical protein